MDPRVEEKLDNFEGVVSSFEEKKARGETISSEQIVILQTALFSIVAHHTIAKWWKDEMSERIKSLTVAIGKFPAAKQEDDSDIDDKIIKTFSTPSDRLDWVFELYKETTLKECGYIIPEPIVLMPKTIFRRDYSGDVPKHVGERFLFNKELGRIELKNTTPELIQDFKNYTWRNNNEIQNKVRDERPSGREEDFPFVFLCGGRQGGKSLCGRKHNGLSPDITQGRLSSED